VTILRGSRFARVLSLSIVGCAGYLSACGGTATDSSRQGTTAGATGGATGSGDGATAGAPSSAPRKCKLHSDCNAGLVCAFGFCHAECETSRDCPANQRCVVQSTDPAISLNVCLLITEAVCHYNTDCYSPLVCAVDLQCRSQCAGDRDCLAGQRCVFGVCSEPSEINPDGTLKGAADAGISSGLPGTPP
jgi:hypothetical protein